jgi:hypothetical protein
MNPKRIKEIKAAIDDLGMDLSVTFSQRGGHMNCLISHPDGRTLNYVTGLTPSDHRANANLARDIRRFFERGYVR